MLRAPLSDLGPRKGGRRALRATLLLVLGALATLQACTDRKVVAVEIAMVTVDPTSVSLVEGQTQQFRATVVADKDRALPRAEVVWESDTPSVVSVDGDGMATALTAGAGTVRATFRGVSGTATITVLAAPRLQVLRDTVPLTPEDTIVFFGGAGAQSPPAQVLQVWNSGGGQLTGLDVTVGFAGGQPGGWLSGGLASSIAPTSLTLTPQSATLPVGVYDATVTVTAAADPDGTIVLPVRLVLNDFTIVESTDSTSLSEASGTDDFTVVLEAQPRIPVVIELSIADSTEVLGDVSRLTFTSSDWDQPQTVTLTGQDDITVDGDRSVAVTLAVVDSLSDPAYGEIPDKTLTATVVDDDQASFTVAESGGATTVSEGGSTDDFSVVLDGQPLSPVVFNVVSGDTGEATVAPAALTFTPSNWSVPQAVTVTGVDDPLVDGDRVTDVRVTVVDASSDDAFDALADDTVQVTTTDDDTAGFAITETQGGTTVSEDGSTTDGFTVVLIARPTSDVTLTITSGDPGEASVTPTTLTFTPVNWLSPQLVTVNGVDDSLIDGPQTSTLTVSVDPAASDDDFDAVPDQTVQVTTTDDDVAGVTVSPTSGLSTTEAGGTASFTIVLDSQPTADVTIGLTSSDLTEGTVDPAIVTFTTVNWSVPQTITVTGQDDPLQDGDVAFAIVTGITSSADANYDGINPTDVSVTNNDDDSAGVTVSPVSGPTTENGAQATFTMVLDTEPTADVTIGLSSDDETEGTIDVASVTFTTANWNVPQTITITGQDDALADGNVPYSIVTAPATSADPDFDGLDPDDVPVTNVDNDTAGVTVSGASGPTNEGGGQATFTIVLNNQPAADVTIGLTSSDATEGTVSPASVTFTGADWNVAQTVTVTGQDDALADGDVAYTIVTAPATSTDPDYDGIDPADVSVTNTDDEVAGVTVSPPTGPTTEGGGLATFTIVLTSQPTDDVTIALTSSDLSEGTVSPASVTFTIASWNVVQTVTVTGQDDALADGNVLYSIVTAPASSSDPDYSGLTVPDVSMTNIDDESAGITVSAASGPTTESGGTATFTIVLDSEPTANVVIGLTSSDVGEGRVSPASVTFTNADWSVPQTVTVTGQDDALADGDVAYTIVTAAAASADPSYNGFDPADVAVTNNDDETAGVIVSAISGPTTESGGQATFTIVLSTEPTADVTIMMTSSDPGEGTVSPASVTFTNVNWSVPQTITVTGQNDTFADGDVAYLIVTAPAASADPDYGGLNPIDVSVTNNDDETAGVTVSPPSGPTTESGGTATFTVVLDSEPTANVTIGLTSSDVTEGTVGPASVTFTGADWSVPQTVTVTGQDDALADGNVAYTIVTAAATSADPDYSGLAVADVAMTNVDDETVGVSVSPVSGPTTEAGGTAAFTVVLDSEPGAAVTIGVSSDDGTEGLVTAPAGGTLTFTIGNWNVPQAVTVTGQDDALADGNVPYTIVTSAATSADPDYDGFDPVDVTVTNNDDETAGVTVSATSGPTTEAGGTATFTIALTTEPTADVTIGLSSTDPTEGTVAPTSVTFTSANWNVAQTVTVTGQDDNIADGVVQYTIVTAQATSADPDYNGLNPVDVSVTNVDDESAGITVSAVSGPTTEAGGTATFTIVLDSEPTANVTIGLASSDGGEGTVSPTSVTFTNTNWSVAQTVTVTGQDDDLADGNVRYTIVTAAATSTDPGYNGLDAADVAVTNTDDETAGITVSAVSGPTTEAGGTATFTIVLDSEPTADVTIGLSSSDVGEGTVSPASVTFTNANWNVAQTVTVTGQNDAVDDGDIGYTIVTAAATSADADYNGVDPADVAVTNVDDETAGVTVSAASGPTTEAGGQATFTIVLATEPTADVTIGLSSSDPSEGAVSPASVTFTNLNWNVPQTITVTGQDDAQADGDIPYTIVTAAAVSADGDYSGMNPANVAVTNIDNEIAGVTVSAASGPTTEAGGTATFTIVLNSEPTADVTIGLSSSDTGEGTVAPASMTFTSLNWNIAQAATVTGQDDAQADGNIPYTIVTAPTVSADPDYSGFNPADVAVTNNDDETAGVTVSAASGPTTEGGGTATFTIALATQPTASVSIGLTSSNDAEGTVSPLSVTFTTGNWNTPQTVTVTGVDDDIDDGNVAYTIVTAAATSGDPNYNGVDPVDVAVTNVDDETAGITVSAASGPTTEGGGQATFTIVLDSEPTVNVTIGLSSSDGGEGTVTTPAGGSLTFTAANWNIAQTVTVTGQDDNVADGDVAYSIVTAAATSADPGYNGLEAADVAFTNNDDETASVLVSAISGPTTEAGGQATFTVVLTSQPTADVTIGLSSSDGGEGTVSPPSLTFTSVNWSVARTVTVTGQDDDVDDGNVAYTIFTAAATSTDASYNGVDPADVAVTNVDDETAGVSVSAASGPTTEAGGQATFTIELDSEPTADVTIGLSSSDVSEGTVSPASVTFTNANWNVAQTVTVTGQNDDVDDGDIGYSVVTAAATSSDPGYNGIDPIDVAVTNVDDETAGVTVSAASGPTTEAGGQATFTIVLNSEPAANVTIGLSSSDLSEGTVSPASVVFTPANWDVAQTVTVTGVDDVQADGLVPYTIVTAAATSPDPTYAGIDPDDVPVTNVDDETPGIIVSAASGPTTEAGDAATFIVVLNSQPTATVTIDVSSDDPTEGVVTAPPGGTLTFTTGNWNVAQTVTVTGVDDDVDDGNIAYTIVTDPAVSGDTNYNGVDPVDVAVTNVDDETAGVTVSAVSGPTTELGGTATFTVVLDSEPTADVTVDVSSGDPSEGTVTAPLSGSLTFTAANWNVAQTVTVTGQNDDIDDGNVAYSIVTDPATSADPNYGGLDPADVGVTNNDDGDTAGVTVSTTGGLVTDETGTTDQFTIVLDSEPIAPVSIGVSSSDPGEGLVTTPAGGTLTFTAANWNVAQPVVVTGQNDDIDDGSVAYSIVTAAATSADPNYGGLDPADVGVTNDDDGDTAGITVTPTSGLTTTEAGGTAQFTIQLDSEPIADVTIALSSTDTGEGTVSPPSVTLTSANWSSPQTVTVTGVDDDYVDGDIGYTIVTAPATSADPNYNTMNASDVSVTNTNDDVASFTIDHDDGSTVVNEGGGTDDVTVVLGAAPLTPVSIALTSTDFAEASVPPTPLTFDDTDWNIPQLVTVTGVDDQFLVDGNTTPWIRASVVIATSDAAWGPLPADSVQITVIDNDQPGLVVTETAGGTTVGESSGIDSIRVALAAQPTVNITVNVGSGDATESSVSPTSLLFTNLNWNVVQFVTVSGVDDAPLVDGDQPSTVTVSIDPSEPAEWTAVTPVPVTVTTTDDTPFGIQITETAGNTTVDESGGNDTFDVQLTAQPAAGVTVTLNLASDDTGESGVSSATLTFTDSDWNVPQTVTVNGVDDSPVADGSQTSTITVSVDGGDPAPWPTASPQPVVVTTTDDDVAGFSLTQTTLTLAEAGPAQTFDVTLDAQPDAGVTVTLDVASGDETAVTVSPAQLTFDAGDWNVGHTVTVTPVNDAVDDGDQGTSVTVSVNGASPTPWSALGSQNVATTTVDDDVAGITTTESDGYSVVTEAAGAGNTDDIDVVLDSEPLSDVVLNVTSNDTGEVTVSPATLTFTPATWNVPQTITLTGQDDAAPDGLTSSNVTISVDASSDDQYDPLADIVYDVFNVDDELQGFVAIATNDTTWVSETGVNGPNTDTFVVLLTTAPAASVTLAVASDDTGEVTASPTTLTFTSADWNVPQVVTVTGVSDSTPDGDQPIGVSASYSSGDPAWSTAEPAGVTVTVVDDDAQELALARPRGDVGVTGAPGPPTFVTPFRASEPGTERVADTGVKPLG